MSSDWAKIGNYSTGFEADMVRATLESSNILVQVRGHQVGIFGGGFQGQVLGGVDVYVPTSDLEAALEVLQQDE